MMISNSSSGATISELYDQKTKLPT